VILRCGIGMRLQGVDRGSEVAWAWRNSGFLEELW